MTDLERTIGYVFRNASLLEQALTTPACHMDRPEVSDNQRLEFLGDAVFGLLSADAVYAAFPADAEGLLTVRRTHLVSGAALADAAERLRLRDHLKFNQGAQPPPPHAKVLADALEALMGAVWLDGGLAAVRTVFAALGLPLNASFNEWDANPKGYLQVKTQAMHPPRRPVYEDTQTGGVAHAPVVTVRVRVHGLGEAVATAGSKTAAEVAAAAALLEKINGSDPA